MHYGVYFHIAGGLLVLWVLLSTVFSPFGTRELKECVRPRYDVPRPCEAPRVVDKSGDPKCELHWLLTGSET